MNTDSPLSADYSASDGTAIPVAGGSAAEPQIIHLFDSQEGFALWARSTRFADAFEHIDDIIRRTQQRADITLEVNPLVNSVEVVANTPIDREWASLRVRPSTKDSTATLYENPRYGGRSWDTGPCAIDDLSDIDFHKEIAGIKVQGISMLSDFRYFSGTRFYIIGDPIVTVPDLGIWGYLRRAASLIVV